MPTPISHLQAVERVKLLADYAAFPEVAGAVVDALVGEAARPDAEGRLPSDDGWLPTYDLNAATAAVWEVKAALVANRYDTTTDGQQLDRAQLLAHMRTMAAMYRQRIASTLRMQPPVA
jgi:hypothetical protein